MSTPSTSVGPHRWRLARRALLALAAVATIIVVFYTVENWRGQRAWENARRKLEAKGEVLDWAAYIPPPGADDQNFYKAPKMKEWFVKGSLRSLISGAGQPTDAPRPFVPAPRSGINLFLAEVRIAVASAATNSADRVLRFDDPVAREQAADLLGETIGPCSIGAKSWLLLARPVEQFKSLHLILQAGSVPSLKEVTEFFATYPLTNSAHASPGISYLLVQTAGSNAFHVYLKAPVYGAADYLAWTEPLTADLELVRTALQRPYARIDCDYQQPYAIGIPNFIAIREMAQLLAQRAQCYLLLGQPEAARHELALVHDLCRILLVKPSGKPITLVGAMIHVAVQGLYAMIVQDGLRLHVWREPQLLAIERQLLDSDLLTPVVEAFREERAATCRTFETVKRGELVKLFNFENPLSKVALTFMPHGWFYQNMAAGAELEQAVPGSVDLTNRVVRPHGVSEIVRTMSFKSEQWSPYRFLLAVALPNFTKALQTAAGNQTLLDQARLACVLERYRLAQGQYPERLEALAPQFIDKLPHDLIGGQPFKYRRTNGEGYLLYSVGWNERDDGGIPGKSREEGDWVWELR